MKGAYFWIQLKSNPKQNSRQPYKLLLASGDTLEIEQKLTPELSIPETAQLRLTRYFGNAIQSIFANLKQKLIDKLARSPKLKIRSYLDQEGNTWWYVYDPITKKTGHLRTEAEVKAWLDKHYYVKDSQFFN